MRATLHFSLLAATLSPSLVHSSPIPFTQNHNSSPRSSSQALSGSGRPGGAFSSSSPLPRGGLGLGLLGVGSGGGGDGGDASSGSSFAQGGDYLGDGDRSSASGGQPVIDLGPSIQPGDQPQPEPVHDAPPNDTKPSPSGLGDDLPPPQNPDDGKNKPSNGDPPAPFQSGPAQQKPPPVNTGDSVTPPHKSDPDPGANETPGGVPIFLGPSNPSNDRPSSEEIGPSSDSSWAADRHGFEDDDGPCDNIFGGSLINILSNNGGDGGDASSGDATSIANDKGSGGLSLSGAGGDASGGSVSAASALINILSNNGGNGGKAKSGDSFSHGNGGSSVSHSGPGGDASGGSVNSICSRRLPISRTLIDYGSNGNVLTRRSRFSPSDSKKKWNDPPAAYSGKGGDASGGSVKGKHGVVNVWSGNGGNGGDASSGSAFAHGPGAKAFSGAGGNAAGGDVGRRELVTSQTSKKMPYPRLSPREKYVPAHSGTGKKYAASKNGAGHHGDGGGLVDVWSGNGGDGGDASSGDAHAYGQRASAYSGPGGHAAGGSVSGGHHDKVWKRDDGGVRNKGAAAYTGPGGNASGGSVFGHGGLIDLFSGNGGDGGDASSGSAHANGGGANAFSGPGGDAFGGSINEGRHRRRYGGILNVASGNGHGGDTGSGGAIAV